jgi:ATP-dependent RNA helicase DeaD
VEQDGVPAAGIARGQNVVFVLPPDWARAETFIGPALERLAAADAPGPQLLVIAADADAAMALAAAARTLGAARGITVLAATSAPRAARALRARSAAVVAGDPATLLGLLRSSALKLDNVQQVVIAWLDDALESAEAALEVLLAEVPKDAARVIVAREITPTIEALIERYARRARRELPAAVDGLAAVPAQYLAVHDAVRPLALRRLLDELDPASAFVFVRDSQRADDVRAALSTMGYAPDGPVRLGDVLPVDMEVLVLYELPTTRAQFHAALGGHSARQVVALVAPRQVAALREIAGGIVNPFVLPEAVQRSRGAEEQMRAALRDVLDAGGFARELLALEPLLAEYDGIEVAAAALRLLEAERLRAVTAAPVHAPAMARLFVNVGETDGFRASDLVGAITGHAGLTGRDVGRVEIRDRHSLVEVPEAAAAAVAARLTGVTVKGRQLVARLDQERPERGPRGPRRPPARPRRPERGDR